MTGNSYRKINGSTMTPEFEGELNEVHTGLDSPLFTRFQPTTDHGQPLTVERVTLFLGLRGTQATGGRRSLISPHPAQSYLCSN